MWLQVLGAGCDLVLVLVVQLSRWWPRRAVSAATEY
jgi:hypothetical protein